MRAWCLLGSFVLVGCAASRPDTHWRATSDRAEPLDVARAACKTHALERSKDVTGQGLAAKVAAGAFAECMRERGWALVDQE